MSKKLFLHKEWPRLTATSVQIVVNGWDKGKNERACVYVCVCMQACVHGYLMLIATDYLKIQMKKTLILSKRKYRAVPRHHFEILPESCN